MALTRRQTLKTFASGFGTLAMADLFADESRAPQSPAAIGNRQFAAALCT